jgi:hypothetical protein
VAVMFVETIHDFNRAVPFVPYEIRTNAGERLRVPHPDFVFVTPRGTSVIVVNDRDGARHINSLLIEEVTPLRSRTRRKRASRRKS